MLHKGETRTNSNTYSLHVLKSLKQPKSNRQHIISCDVVSVYITRQAMDWNIITSAAEALNGTIIFLCSWDGASDLKCLMGSRAYSEWLTLPLNCSALDRCQAAILCNIQWTQCTDLMTAWSPELQGTPVGKWLLYRRWESWDHPQTHFNAKTHTANGAIVALWLGNSNVTWLSAAVWASLYYKHISDWVRDGKNTWRWRWWRWQLVIHSFTAVGKQSTFNTISLIPRGASLQFSSLFYHI